MPSGAAPGAGASSVAFSASSLQWQSVGRNEDDVDVYVEKVFEDVPQELKDALHPPDGEDLVLDLLPARGDLGRADVRNRARVVPFLLVRVVEPLRVVLELPPSNQYIENEDD